MFQLKSFIILFLEGWGRGAEGGGERKSQAGPRPYEVGLHLPEIMT